MSKYFVVHSKWLEVEEKILVPEHTVKNVTEETNINTTSVCCKIHLIGGGTYTVHCTLEQLIDSGMVEL